jgi:uncharacterized protein YegL
MNESLALMVDDLADDPEAQAIGHLAIVTFADEAKTHYPLTHMEKTGVVDVLPRGGWTNYVGAWDHMLRQLGDDIRQLEDSGHRIITPTIFFISDGQPGGQDIKQPTAEWKRYHDKLFTDLGSHKPRIVALGMGGVREDTILAVRSVDPAGPACIAEPGALASDLLKSMMREVLASIRTSAARGEFVFTVPPGMRRIDR